MILSKLMPEGSRRRKIVKQVFFEAKIPIHISSNFVEVHQTDLNSIKHSLQINFFSKSPEGYLSTDIGKNDLMDHLLTRIENKQIRQVYNLGEEGRIKLPV